MSPLTIGQAALLGILQGLTEFLPVSSSGHLLLARELLGLRLPGLSFEVLLHLGTALAVVVVLRREVLAVISAILRWRSRTTAFALGWRLVLASVPAALAAWIAGDLIEARLASAPFAAAMLLVTACILFIGGRYASVRRVRGRTGLQSYPLRPDVPSPRAALAVGVAQAVAILPGVSRSGSTVVAGLAAGLSRDSAARFSLLLSLPVIFGGALFDAAGLAGAGLGELPLWPSLTGVCTAFLAGLVSAGALLRLVRQAKLAWFGVYCAIAGLAGLWLTR